MIDKIKELIWGKAPVLWYPDERIFKVVKCDNMQSCEGMQTKGKPTVNNSFIVASGKEFRTLKPLKIIDTDTGFTVETSHLNVEFIEIK